MIDSGWFLTNLAGGGAERIPLLISPSLQRTRLSVVLLKDEIEHEIPVGDPPILTLSARGRSLARTGGIVLARAVRAARQFDVLVAGLEWAPTYFAVAAGVLAHRPVVATVHSDLRRFAEVEGVPRAWWLGMRAALRRCAAAIAVSSGAGRSLVELGMAPDRVHVIPPPGPSWRVTERSATGDRPRLLTVAGLRPVKGIDLALETAMKLGDLDFEWTVVGDGPEREELLRRREELGLVDRVSFVGFQPDPERFYRDADLYVLPSRTEGAPLALIEALTARLPVVAMRCGAGVEEVVTAEVGRLVPSGDTDAMAQAIRQLLGDPERRLRLSDAAYRRSRQSSPSAIAARYDDVLSMVAEAACSRPSRWKACGAGGR